MSADAGELADERTQLSLDGELFIATSCYFIGTLSPKSKNLLTLPEEERTGSAFSNLLAEFENIVFFKMFSNHTKEWLAKALKFVINRADELLLSQGETDDPPQALYVIMSGVVTEHYKPQDGSVVWPQKILRKGEFFGHLDIVYNRPPTADARTVGYSELLMLPRKDFQIVRKELENQCTRVSRCLRTVKAISRFCWSDDEYKALEIYSKLCTYSENQDIYAGSENDKQFWSHFVVLGECRVARELTYCVTESGHLKAVPRKEFRERGSNKLTTKRFVFEEVKQGYYFGVGESFREDHVIANSTLECLLIPRLLLVFKNKKLLEAMARDLTDSLPSDQEVLDGHSKLVATSKKKDVMLRKLV